MKPGMRKSGYWCILLVITLGILFNAQLAQSLGVTRPVPYDIELMRGESAGFTFQIQAVTSTERLLCSYSISGLESLEIDFEEEEAVVDAGSIKNVYGTITVPEGFEIKTYNGRLSVSCGAYSPEDVSGSAVRTTIGGSAFNIKVVEVRDSDIRKIEPPAKPVDYTTIIIALAIIIIIVAAGVYYWFRKSRKK